jgi:hypothetical protein
MRFLPAAAFVVVLGLGTGAWAQRGVVEFGFDLGVNARYFDDQSICIFDPFFGPFCQSTHESREITVGIPVQDIRVGVFLTDRFEIEQSLTLYAQWDEGQFEGSIQNFRISQLLHFTESKWARPFFKLGVGLNEFDVLLAFGAKPTIGHNQTLRIEAGAARGNRRSDLFFRFGVSILANK